VPNGTHDIHYCAKMTEKVLIAQFEALKLHNVYLPGAVLKPNMVKNGIQGPKASTELIATLTVQTLLNTVPPAMPGIFFLSGETALDEDNEEVATINLSKMNELFQGKMPWHLSFSYGKALQKTAIVTWLGKEENKEAAQKALKAKKLRRTKKNPLWTKKKRKKKKRKVKKNAQMKPTNNSKRICAAAVFAIAKLRRLDLTHAAVASQLNVVLLPLV